jgi:hypothetical protein
VKYSAPPLKVIGVVVVIVPFNESPVVAGMPPTNSQATPFHRATRKSAKFEPAAISLIPSRVKLKLLCAPAGPCSVQNSTALTVVRGTTTEDIV